MTRISSYLVLFIVSFAACLATPLSASIVEPAASDSAPVRPTTCYFFKGLESIYIACIIDLNYSVVVSQTCYPQ